MRFNNEDERLANASFLFFFFFSLELVRPRGVVVVQFVQFRFKYLRIFFIRMPAVGSVLTKKMKKHERSFFPPFWWRKEALFVLFDPKKVVSGSLFGCFARERERERERESGQKTLIIKSLEERKKELLIERTKRNARTTRKRRKRKRKRRTKRFLRFL